MNKPLWFGLLPGAIALLAVTLPVPGLGQSAAPLEQALHERFTAHLQRIDAPGFSVAVVKAGELVFADGFGLASIGKPAQMSPDTMLAIGSVTKSLTALLVFQLVEEGLLDLDEPVTRYLPWFRTSNVALSDQIRLRHLLTMTSGMEARFAQLTRYHDASSDALRKGVRRLRGYRMVSAPGERFLYVNENWNVLGLIIETVTGLTFEDALASRVFKPLGMTRSAADRESIGALAPDNGHYHGAPPKPASFLHLQTSIPAGSGVYSTASDMGRYVAAMLSEEAVGGDLALISAQSREQMWEPAIPMKILPRELGGTGEPGSYAMGWMRLHVHGRDYVFHGGEFRLSSSMLLMDPERGDGIFILYNTGNLNPYRSEMNLKLADSVMRQLAGEPETDFAIPRQPEPDLNTFAPSALADSVFASYTSSEGDRLALSRGGSEGVRASLFHITYPTDFDIDFVNNTNFIARNTGDAQTGSLRYDDNGTLRTVYLNGVPYHRSAPISEAGTHYQATDKTFSLRLPKDWTMTSSANGFVALSTDENARLFSLEKPLEDIADGSPIKQFTDAIAGYRFDGVLLNLGDDARRLCMTTSQQKDQLSICLDSSAESLSLNTIRFLNPVLNSLRFE